ncbi:MAG: MFS transporter [Clostridia bacterium]|nr:MFS transporter [Clostridia bacterium]
MKKNNRFIFFCLLVGLQGIAANLAHPITPTLIKELNLPSYMFGLMFACMSGFNFLFSPFWGKLADYFDSRKIISMCLLGYGLGQFFFWQAGGSAAVLFARCFSGLFIGGVGVCQLTYIVNTSDDLQRGSRLTIYATTSTVTGMFGFLIGGLLGEISLSLTFLIQVVMLMLTGVLYGTLLEKDNFKEKGRIKAKVLVRDANPFSAFVAGKQFMTKAFAVLFAVTLFSMFASTAYDQCFNYYIKDQFGFSSAYNGIIKAAVGIISLIANMTVCMFILKKTNVAKSNCIILISGTVLMAGVVITGNVAVFITLAILYLAVNAISVPVLQSLVSAKAESRTSNLVMGFYNAMKSLGMVIGALIAGFIYEINPKMPFGFAAASFGIAFLFALVYAVKFNPQKK